RVGAGARRGRRLCCQRVQRGLTACREGDASELRAPQREDKDTRHRDLDRAAHGAPPKTPMPIATAWMVDALQSDEQKRRTGEPEESRLQNCKASALPHLTQLGLECVWRSVAVVIRQDTTRLQSWSGQNSRLSACFKGCLVRSADVSRYLQ